MTVENKLQLTMPFLKAFGEFNFLANVHMLTHCVPVNCIKFYGERVMRESEFNYVEVHVIYM